MTTMSAKILWIAMVCVAFFGFAPSAQAESTKVLGRLGQTLKSTKIYGSPSTRGRIYYRPKAFEYIVLRTTRNKLFHRVLMSNGADGYVLRNAVAELPYEVTTKASNNLGGPAPATRAALANYATKYVGTPYVWGGNDINNGIDCSAFVKQLYGKVGVSLPRTAAEQALVGRPITRLEELQPGDRLYFWERKRNKIGHTGIYMGNGWFVHSSRGKGGVGTDYLSEKWRKILVAARR
jgi:cell wall-associated NlpC family hydrolase